MRLTPAEKILPCPVSTIALASDLRSSINSAASASQNSMSSALALPCWSVSTAMPASVLMSIMGRRSDTRRDATTARRCDADVPGADSAVAHASSYGDCPVHDCDRARRAVVASRRVSERRPMIDIKTEAGIAVLTLQHGKANALDIEFCEALAAECIELRKSDAKAIVLTGQGKIFSAGVNLIKLSGGGAGYIRKFLPVLHRLYDAVFYHPKPVVAAINGHAIAGGCVLACCADRRVMSNDGGRMGVTEILVGVPFPALAFEIVRFAVPPRYLAEFALGGATYVPNDALQRGWVDEVVERGGTAK